MYDKDQQFYAYYDAIEETGEVITSFKSIVEASEKTGIAKSSIGACCRGNYNHAGDYFWRFVNP